MIILKKGSRGAAVVALQKNLAKVLNISVLTYGVFGPTTESLVRKFQSKNGLKVDGEYGPKSDGVMVQLLKKIVGGYTLSDELLVFCFKIPLETAKLYLPAMQETVSRFDLTTANRLSMFFANLAHESGNLVVKRENMNYSTKRLTEVWPGRYKNKVGLPNELALAIGGKPELVANYTYANRMGNGGPETGDGYNYRGGGLCQLTGRDAYRDFGNVIGEDLLSNPDLISQPRYAVLSAGWEWDRKNLNEHADNNDFDKVCDEINLGHETAVIGDSIGWKDRKAKLLHMQKYIK